MHALATRATTPCPHKSMKSFGTQMREQNIPGVSLAVIRDGKIIKAAGYGLANVELNSPVTPQSVFTTCSIAKQFVAVGVMMLVEQGKVALDESVTKYLPNSPPAWKDITRTTSVDTHFGCSRLRIWTHALG